MEHLHGRIRVVKQLHLTNQRCIIAATILLVHERDQRDGAPRVRAVELRGLAPVVAAREHDVLVPVLVRVAERVPAAVSRIAEVRRRRQLRPVRCAPRRVALPVRPLSQVVLV